MMKRAIFALSVSVVLATASAQAGVIFEQDFSSSTNLGDYIATPGTSTQFDGAGTTGGTASIGITSGALQVDIAPNDPTPQGYAGFVWEGGSSLDYMQMHMSLNVDTGGFSNANNEIQISLGAFASGIYDWNILSTGGDTAKAWVIMQGSSYLVKTGTLTTSLASGATAEIGFFVNCSGDSTTFLGDDGLIHTLGNNSKALFVNGVLVADNIAVDKTSGVRGLRVNTNCRANQNVDDGVFRFDNIEIRDDLVPEPATMGLLVIGAAAMLRKRRVA